MRYRWWVPRGRQSRRGWTTVVDHEVVVTRVVDHEVVVTRVVDHGGGIHNNTEQNIIRTATETQKGSGTTRVSTKEKEEERFISLGSG